MRNEHYLSENKKKVKPMMDMYMTVVGSLPKIRILDLCTHHHCFVGNLISSVTVLRNGPLRRDRVHEHSALMNRFVL